MEGKEGKDLEGKGERRGVKSPYQFGEENLGEEKVLH